MIGSLLTLLLLAGPAAVGAELPGGAIGADAGSARSPLTLVELEVAERPSEVREAARKARALSLEQLRTIIRDSPGPFEPKTELLQRLADLYFDEGRDLQLARFDDPNLSRAVEARAWTQRAVKLYRTIEEHYPSYSRADEVAFFLGSAYLDLDLPDLAAYSFLTLPLRYPDSRYVGAAHLELGDYYFHDRQDYPAALIAYERASNDALPERQAFVLYKMAWCQWELGRPQLSFSTMSTVVQTVDATEPVLKARAESDLAWFSASDK